MHILALETNRTCVVGYWYICRPTAKLSHPHRRKHWNRQFNVRYHIHDIYSHTTQNFGPWGG